MLNLGNESTSEEEHQQSNIETPPSSLSSNTTIESSISSFSKNYKIRNSTLFLPNKTSTQNTAVKINKIKGIFNTNSLLIYLTRKIKFDTIKKDQK